jgi:hypothetical protein
LGNGGSQLRRLDVQEEVDEVHIPAVILGSGIRFREFFRKKKIFFDFF